jgi:hypothetical protein
MTPPIGPETMVRASSLAFQEMERPARGLRREGFEDGGVGAVGFLAHRIVVGGSEDGDRLAGFGDLFLHDVAHAPLMFGIPVAVQQGDDDAFHILFDQFLRRLARHFLAQRDHHLAEHVDALHHPAGEMARHQRIVEIVRVEVDAILIGEAQIGLDRAAHAVEVLHAGIDDEAGAQALALHHAVQHRRAGIDAGLDGGQSLVELEAPLAKTLAGAFDQPQRFVFRGRLRLADHELAVGIDEERIGHGAAGIDAEHLHRSRILFLQLHSESSLHDRTRKIGTGRRANVDSERLGRTSDFRTLRRTCCGC